VIEEKASTVDVPAPFGTQRVVDGDQKLFEFECLDDQGKKSFEENLGTKLEMTEEAVETRFVTTETGAVTKATDMPLTGLDQPRDGHRRKIRPASFGKSQTKTEENLGKFRCRMVSNHSPFSGGCELVSSPFASEFGLFFLSAVSLN